MRHTCLLTLTGVVLLAAAGCRTTSSSPTSATALTTTSSGTADAAATAAPGSGVSQTAGKGVKPPPTQAATAVFRCPGPACAGTDRVAGDGLGAYNGSIDGGSGEFLLQLTNAARSLTIDYRDQLDTTRGRRWFDTITVNSILLHTNVVFPGTDTQTPGGLRDVPVGATWPARMKLGYPIVSPQGLSLEFGDRFNPTAYPGSTHMRVTRLAESQWSLEATTDEIAHVRSIADRRHGGEIFEGLYHLTFQLTVTAQ